LCVCFVFLAVEKYFYGSAIEIRKLNAVAVAGCHFLSLITFESLFFLLEMAIYLPLSGLAGFWFLSQSRVISKSFRVLSLFFNN
jgi:hypothetical protein